MSRPDRPTPVQRRGLVIVNWRRHLLVEAEDGALFECITRGRDLKPVCGDRVSFRDDPGGSVVETVEPRRTALARHDGRRGRQALAANVDLMLIVCAPTPAADPFLLDKYTVAAAALGIEPMIVVNKADVLDEAHPLIGIADEYRTLGIRSLPASAALSGGLEDLRATLVGRTAVLVGQSGVGKSSIVQGLVPEHDQRIGELSVATAEGRHTTTHTMLFHVPGGGDLIDSPGVRDFMLWPMPVAELARCFVEFAGPARTCRFADCTHRHEPSCAVRAAVDAGAIPFRRYESYAGLARIMDQQFVAWER